jgi:hypothetical protein
MESGVGIIKYGYRSPEQSNFSGCPGSQDNIIGMGSQKFSELPCIKIRKEVAVFKVVSNRKPSNNPPDN